jgi:hypothetical protein
MVFRILRPALAVISTLMASAAQQSSPDSFFPAFQSQARLVLLFFHVTRGKNYVANLKPSDIVLLEDGNHGRAEAHCLVPKRFLERA